MPLLILLLLLVFFFWITALVLALGLVLGFRYRFGGPDLDRESMDRATARLSSKAAALRDKIRAALQEQGVRPQAVTVFFERRLVPWRKKSCSSRTRKSWPGWWSWAPIWEATR